MFLGHPQQYGTFAGGDRLARMAERAVHPPIHLVTHPDEPIRSLEAAAKVIRRHAGDHLDPNAQDLLQHASMLQEADAAGNAFRAWAEAQGLLLVPPEDGKRT
jgi:hypothetical protein